MDMLSELQVYNNNNTDEPPANDVPAADSADSAKKKTQKSELDNFQLMRP